MIGKNPSLTKVLVNQSLSKGLGVAYAERVIHFLFLVLLSVTHKAQAETGYGGFYGYIGARAMNNNTTSTVSYDMTNLFGGSISAPGYRKQAQYELTAYKYSAIPSGGLLYILAGSKLSLGVSVGVSQITASVSSKKFNLTPPTGVGDYPREFYMRTKFHRSYDFEGSLQPGYQFSNLTMMFVKLSYHQLKAQMLTETNFSSGLSSTTITEASANKTFVGYGAGLGLRYKPTDQFYVEGLVEYVTYNKKKIDGSRLVSYGDEVTMTQTQEIQPRWLLYGLAFGTQF